MGEGGEGGDVRRDDYFDVGSMPHLAIRAAPRLPPNI